MSSLRILPLGGVGNVTKNMYLYEYQDQILIVDCGIGFPTSDLLGIDVLIPDITYLKDRTHQIVGMLLTHAHDDHIAALPYIIPQLPEFPIYGSALTIGFAADRLRDFEVHKSFDQFPDDGVLELGPFKIESIKVTHSVPDSRHYAIHTPIGTIYHGSDYKFDLTPVDGVISDYQKIARLGREGILCLLIDCLRSEKSSHSLSESLLTDTFEREIKDTHAKYIVTAMSSNVHRIQQAVNVAVNHGRKVAFLGRSIEQNIKTATKLGFFHINPKSIIHKRQINKLPPNQVCVIIAGSQGQPESSLSRAAIGDHDLIKIGSGDKVVFSTEAIPGNENYVYQAVDNLSKSGADVSYSDIDDNLHVSGHASALEQKLLVALTKPKYLYPIGGTYRHGIQFQKIAASMGYHSDHIILMDEAKALSLESNSISFGEKLKLKNVMVDGLGIGDVGNVVLTDRQHMSTDGIVVVVVPVSRQTGLLTGQVEVISRGFVFMKEAGPLVEKIISTTQSCLQQVSNPLDNQAKIRKKIEHTLADLLYTETQRSPLILPAIMEV